MKQIKERPIIFSGPMVRAILDGRKTQTRREVKNIHPKAIDFHGFDTETNEAGFGLAEKVLSRIKCPYGNLGDRLYVRESFFLDGSNIAYRADHEGYAPKDTPWKPSIHMPRLASRILLEITNVCVERLQDISEEDAESEGLAKITKDGSLWKYGIPDYDGLPGGIGWEWRNWKTLASSAFMSIWQSIHGPESWNANPWVWAITFKRIEP